MTENELATKIELVKCKKLVLLGLWLPPVVAFLVWFIMVLSRIGNVSVRSGAAVLVSLLTSVCLHRAKLLYVEIKELQGEIDGAAQANWREEVAGRIETGAIEPRTDL